MPKIKMLVDAQGCSDGFTARLYKRGQEYEVSKALANNFVIQQGVAEPVPILQRRSVPAAPENAMVTAAPENKSMESLRVFQLANRLGISSVEVIKLAKKLGIIARAPASGLSEEDVNRITAEVS